MEKNWGDTPSATLIVSEKITKTIRITSIIVLRWLTTFANSPLTGAFRRTPIVDK